MLPAFTAALPFASGGHLDRWRFQQLVAQVVARMTNGLIAVELDEFDDRFWT